MSIKEERVLNEIIIFFNYNKTMPTMRYLQKKLGYKSVNSITWYIKSLLKQNYLFKNSDGKIVIYNESNNYKDGLKKLTIINTKNKFINLYLNKNKNYLAYKIRHNYFNKMGILKNDILIIEINKKLKNNDLGLFIIDNEYRIMNYYYKDGFYLLKDKEELVLYQTKIIGKVIMIEKKL